MLTPNQLEALPERLVFLYGEAEADILSDMAKRIAARGDFIPAAEWQYYKLREMGLLRREIVARLARTLRVTEEELLALIQRAGALAVRDDDAVYRAAGLRPSPLDASPALREVLDAGYRNTLGLFDNLTRTTADTATRQFERALDRGYLLATTGGLSQTEAARRTIRELSAAGVEAIAYPSGHTDQIDVAVRRAARTGVGLTALRLQDTRADEMGCDLVETSAHAGARPSHQEWQGKIFSRSGSDPRYPDFARSTGYGTGAGLGGWNCRHSFYPYFEGISSPAYSQEERAGLLDRTVTANGEALSLYEATQRQRYYERQIRRWKREYLAMEAAKLDAGEAAARLARYRREQNEFLDATGLRRQASREEVPGFGRSEAGRAREKGAKRI